VSAKWLQYVTRNPSIAGLKEWKDEFKLAASKDVGFSIGVGLDYAKHAVMEKANRLEASISGKEPEKPVQGARLDKTGLFH
jgi:hypothetical protein